VLIPVVLPSAKATPDLPWTLANLHWVDLRVTNPDPLKQLIWGITGQNLVNSPPIRPRTNRKHFEKPDLLPRKDKVVIELRLPGNLNEFSEKERDIIPGGLYELLELGEVRVTRAMAGSIRLHVELTPEDADKIYVASENGRLAALGGIVVCCRLMEHQWLPKRLKLNGAICLESLSSEEVNKYLDRGGSKLAALRQAINTDPVLQELTQTPLMLSIMSLACQGASGNELVSQKGIHPRNAESRSLASMLNRCSDAKERTLSGFQRRRSAVGFRGWLGR
jgi:hypothetical protein